MTKTPKQKGELRFARHASCNASCRLLHYKQAFKLQTSMICAQVGVPGCLAACADIAMGPPVLPKGGKGVTKMPAPRLPHPKVPPMTVPTPKTVAFTAKPPAPSTLSGPQTGAMVPFAAPAAKPAWPPSTAVVPVTGTTEP